MVFGLPRSSRICWARAMTSGRAASSLNLGDVDGDGERLGPGDVRCLPSASLTWTCGLDAGAEEAAAAAQEVGGVAGALEADEVGAEQALEDAAPGELGEDLRGRERDVVEEADAQVGAQLAEDAGPVGAGSPAPRRWRFGAARGGGLGEAPVDLR